MHGIGRESLRGLQLRAYPKFFFIIGINAAVVRCSAGEIQCLKRIISRMLFSANTLANN